VTCYVTQAGLSLSTGHHSSTCAVSNALHSLQEEGTGLSSVFVGCSAMTIHAAAAHLCQHGRHCCCLRGALAQQLPREASSIFYCTHNTSYTATQSLTSANMAATAAASGEPLRRGSTAGPCACQGLHAAPASLQTQRTTQTGGSSACGSWTTPDKH
jgi:hypothetical protein